MQIKLSGLQRGRTENHGKHVAKKPDSGSESGHCRVKKLERLIVFDGCRANRNGSHADRRALAHGCLLERTSRRCHSAEAERGPRLPMAWQRPLPPIARSLLNEIVVPAGFSGRPVPGRVSVWGHQARLRCFSARREPSWLLTGGAFDADIDQGLY